MRAALSAIRWPSAKAVTLAILAAGFLATLAASLPGQLSYDSIVQLADARSGRYHTWHPPIMAWLMGLGDKLLPGTAVYLTGVASLIYGAFALLILTRPKVGWAAPPVAFLLCASPLMLNEQGIVWKDVLFANATVAGFLLLSIAARDDRDRQDRWLLTAGSMALFTLGAMVRQNGVIIAAFGAGALAWLLWKSRSGDLLRARLLRSAGVAAGVFLAMLLTVAAATAALNSRAVEDNPGTAGQVRMLQFYDLVGIAKRAPSIDLSALATPGLADHLRGAVKAYTGERVDPVSTEPVIAEGVDKGAPGLDAAWRGAILRHPGAFLAHRLEVMRWMLLPPDVDKCGPVFTGVDGPKAEMAQLNIRRHWRDQDLRLSHWGEIFLPTPLYIHAVWALAAVGLIGWLAFSKAAQAKAQDRVLAVMLVAGLVFTASFLAIGVACDHRYLYAMDLGVMAVLLHVAAGLRRTPSSAQPGESQDLNDLSGDGRQSRSGLSGQRPTTS